MNFYYHFYPNLIQILAAEMLTLRENLGFIVSQMFKDVFQFVQFVIHRIERNTC